MSQLESPNTQLDFSNAVLKAWLNYASQDSSLFDRLLSCVGVDRSWIENESEWHSVEFHEIFLSAFSEIYGADAATKATQAMYAKQGFRLGQSALGLLVTPKIFLGQLPRMAKRMNHYSSFHFAFTGSSVTRSSGILRQEYRDPNRHALNMHLCEACQASTQGVFKTLGYKLLSMTESKCVSKGDSYCECKIEWVNRVGIGTILLSAGVLVTAIELLSTGLTRSFPTDGGFNSTLLGSGLASAALGYFLSQHRSRKRLKDAFEYQQETLEQLRLSLELQQELNRGLVEYQSQYEKTLSLARIGELSYGIIHDMASPISLIRLGTDLLDKKIDKGQSEKSPEEFQKSFNLIQKSTDRLLNLQNLLRRFVAQNESSPWVETDIAQVTKDTAHFYAVAADKAGISLQIEIASGTKTIRLRSKESYIERAVINLLNNAMNILRTHTQKKLVVRLDQSPTGDIHLSIEDSGPGIPQERLGKLFDRFGHSSSNTPKPKDEFKGSGWGLYSIHAMMHEMGGDLCVESSPAGTKATLVFPASLIIETGTTQGTAA